MQKERIYVGRDDEDGKRKKSADGERRERLARRTRGSALTRTSEIYHNA